MKKDTFLKGAFILGISGIVVKILGAFFRIPLGNIIGSEGFGYFQVGYPIYTFLLSFSAVGFPTAISKIVSEKRAKGDYQGSFKAFKVSLWLFCGIGIVMSLVLGLGARTLVNDFIKSPNAYYAVVALAPALFFMTVMGAFRGFFQGRQNMVPTGLSQIVEQGGRVLLGLALSYFLMGYSVELAAAGAAFGATAGAISGLLLIIFLYYREKKNIEKEIIETVHHEEERTGKILSEIIKISIPFTIGAAVLPLINLIDTFLVLRRLQATGFTYSQANVLFGQLQGMASTVVQLPQVFTVALATSIVPVISDSMVKGDWEGVHRDTKAAVRVSMLIGLPAAVGLAVLAGPIMALLFPKEPSSVGEILFYLSFAVLFLTQLQTLTAVLQGVGKANIPVRNLLIGVLCKFILTYVLTGIPSLNVKGAALGTVAAYMVATVLNFLSVKKYTKASFDGVQFIVRPVIDAGVMGVVVWVIYGQMISILGSKLATVVSIAIGAAVYGIMLFVTKTIGREDFDLIPGGGKIVPILEKLKLLK